MHKNFILIAFSALALLSCGKINKTEEEHRTEYAVSGFFQKGPFQQGTKVELQTYDAINNSGVMFDEFSTNIIDGSGRFDFGKLSLESNYVCVRSKGKFFNELKGELSDWEISLSAIVDLKKTPSISVNILTGLRDSKVSRLQSEGMKYEEAFQHAQEVVLSAFGLQKYKDKDFAQFNIADGSDYAAALIVASVALTMDSNKSIFDMRYTGIKNEILLDDSIGKGNRESLVANMRYIGGHHEEIENNILNYYKSLGQTITVKSLIPFLDLDGDGIAGNETNPEQYYL